MTRFLLYSHDTYGLGHFRRCSLLAAGLVGADPSNEVLIVTGSPRAQAFALPDRVDIIKLPAATKDDGGSYKPRRLGGGIADLIKLRGNLVWATVASYEPHVVLVDHAPAGMGGELHRLLTNLDQLPRRPRMALGLRDIIDDPGRVDSSWHRDGIWNLLNRYDDIYVYGDPNVVTTAQELGLERRTTATVSHTGYVAPTMPDPLAVEPFLLVTPGGGGDGQVLLRRYLDGVEAGATAGVRSLIVTGPLLSAGRRAELLVRAERLDSVELVEFSDRMRSLIASAIGVISMAGYNTVVEELAAGTPALLVPRRTPRLEQHIRATRLAPATLLDHCPIEALSPHRIHRFVADCSNHTTTATGIDLSGVATVVNALCPSNKSERSPAHV